MSFGARILCRFSVWGGGVYGGNLATSYGVTDTIVRDPIKCPHIITIKCPFLALDGRELCGLINFRFRAIFL